MYAAVKLVIQASIVKRISMNVRQAHVRMEEPAMMVLTHVCVSAQLEYQERTVRQQHRRVQQTHVRTLVHVLITLLHKDMEELVRVLFFTKELIATT